MLEFPDTASAQERYESPAYQAIPPLRTEHATSVVALVEGAGGDYRAADKIRQLFPAQGAPVAVGTSTTRLTPLPTTPRRGRTAPLPPTARRCSRKGCGRGATC
ncbi:DUF1330 domain-containing protein [Streptomyces sp. NPDC008125]|uniref:DUF1330 domain-containing protein n=1 Tax=Streptomyces sp. NPDC008125 TaxID=3364811 RepID=UPI0036E89404